MDEYRSMLLLIFSKDAPLERVAGINGIVRSLLNFVSLDGKWIALKRALLSQVNSRMPHVQPREIVLNEIDHFLTCLREAYPRLSTVQTDATCALIDFIRSVHWDHFQECGFILPRLFDIFKTARLTHDILAQAVFQCYGELKGTTRFSKNEVPSMNFSSLFVDGIVITSIREDFKQCNVELWTSRFECVNVEVTFPDNYPFRAPAFRFLGSRRPKLFEYMETIRMDIQFEWLYISTEGCLRTVLFEMETQGVVTVTSA